MKHRIAYSLVALSIVGLFMAMTAQAPIGGRTEPLPSRNFRVEIDGVVQASFSEVSGLGCQTEVIEYREGGDSGSVRYLPGLTRCGPVILKSGLTNSKELWNWYKSVMDGNVQRKSASIVVMDNSKVEQARYNLFECWPTMYAISPLDASSSGVLVEELDLAVERIERA